MGFPLSQNAICLDHSYVLLSVNILPSLMVLERKSNSCNLDASFGTDGLRKKNVIFLDFLKVTWVMAHMEQRGQHSLQQKERHSIK